MPDSSVLQCVIVHNMEELDCFAANFIGHLIQDTKYKIQNATIIGLSGPLGAGKTTFAQGVARALGVKDVVNSPTFVIMKKYTLTDHPWDSLIHIDAYRLDGGEELERLGWQEIATNPKNLIIIEWIEKVKDIMPYETCQISFEVLDGKTREISTSLVCVSEAS
jgi:tRNA threonylcarbamoyladenosine biosynthesis protein TsaE